MVCRKRYIPDTQKKGIKKISAFDILQMQERTIKRVSSPAFAIGCPTNPFYRSSWLVQWLGF